MVPNYQILDYHHKALDIVSFSLRQNHPQTLQNYKSIIFIYYAKKDFISLIKYCSMKNFGTS
jgi:hypothetical protein